MSRPTRFALALCGLAVSACERTPPATPAAPTCRAELRSWVVLGRGRHMYLEIEAPPGHEHLSGRVEYTTASLRSDYDPTADASGAPRVARYRGPGSLRPPSFAPKPDNRVEAIYILTIEQARCLQRDRVFSARYVLVGTNSSSGLRRAMEDCGVPLPDHVARAGGVLGEFPGVELDPGQELPREQWGSHGVTPAIEPGIATR